jgi:hypothetical protein
MIALMPAPPYRVPACVVGGEGLHRVLGGIRCGLFLLRSSDISRWAFYLTLCIMFLVAALVITSVQMYVLQRSAKVGFVDG